MEYSDNSAPFDDFSNELDSQYLMEPNEGIMEDAEDAVTTYPLGMITNVKWNTFLIQLEFSIRNYIFY